MTQFLRGFPGDSDSKESACTAGDPGLIPGLERSPGKGIGCPLQYSCLENPMDTGAWQATVHGVAKNRTLATDISQFLWIRSLGKISLGILLRISLN